MSASPTRACCRLLAALLAAALLLAGCSSTPPAAADLPTATATPAERSPRPSPAPAKTVDPAQALQASIEAAVRATQDTQALAATRAVPTRPRLPTPTPFMAIFAQPTPFRHEPSGIAGLMPSGWVLEGNPGGVSIHPASGGPSSLSATLTTTAQLPADGPAALVSNFFAQIKRPGLQVIAEARTPDGGGERTVSTGDQGVTTSARAVLTERGLLMVRLSVTNDQLYWEREEVRLVFDSVELSGDYLSAVSCLWPLTSRPLTAQDVYVIDFDNPGPGFAQPIWYSGGGAVTFEASGIADFNGDGRQDLAVVAKDDANESGQLYILPQGPDGTLAAPNCFNLKGSDHTLAVGDLSGDGLADVAVSGSGSDQKVYVFLGATEGIFSTRRAYPAGSNPPDIVVGDLSGDGRADLALARGGDPFVDLLLQQADGDLAPTISLPADSTGNADLAVGDLNGDGLLDLVKGFYSRDSILNVFLQQADHSFASEISQPNPEYLSADSIAVGDVTGDGRDDVVVSSVNSLPNAWAIIFDLGSDGRLSEMARYPLRSDATATGLADLDGDGRLDVILVSTVGVNVLPQQADGRLGAAQSYLTVRTSPRPQSMSVGDLNGDGRLDIVTAGQGFSLLYGKAP